MRQRLALALAGVLVIAGCTMALATASPRPSTGAICSLLSVSEIQADVPSARASGPAEEGTTGAIRFCHWGAVELNVGPYQALLDQTPSSTGDARIQTIEGLGTAATGVTDAVRVSLFVQTDRGAFSLFVSAYEGVTIDGLISLARRVVDRI